MTLEELPEPRFDSTLFLTHPLLSIATVAELKAAYSEVEERLRDDLSDNMLWKMNGRDNLALFTQAEEWIPLVKMRYRNLRILPIIPQKILIVWSAVDVWQVQIALVQGTYAYQFHSAVTKKGTGYYAAQKVSNGAPIIRKLEVPNGAPGWLPGRPLSSVISESEALRFIQHDKFTTLAPNHAEWNLHMTILNNV